MTTEEKFRVERRQIHDIECLELNGFLDAHTAPILENEIGKSLSQSKYKLLMNFRNLDYISSAGLGVFMSFIEEVRDKGGDIKMSSMNDKVFSVFDLLGFPMLFDIHREEEYLIDKFFNPAKE
ncbi:STAS domain-containing protein [Candidatus Kapaibacterium sp.]